MTKIKIHTDNQVQYYLPKWLKENLILRAYKRKQDITQIDQYNYICRGNASLSDTYPEYEITHDKITNRWNCSCQKHVGGEFRGQCSHIAAVLLTIAMPEFRVVSLGEWEEWLELKQHHFNKSCFVCECDNTNACPVHNYKLWLSEQPPGIDLALNDFENFSILHQDNTVEIQENTQVTNNLPDCVFDNETEFEAIIRKLKAQFSNQVSNPVTEIDTHQAETQFEIFTTNTPINTIENTLEQKITPLLPLWCQSIRPGQLDALKQILTALNSGKKNILLEGPTGIGKTLIAYLAAKLFNCRANYICTTKNLQEQAQKDFVESEFLKGRVNYPTADYAHEFPEISCTNCTFKKQYGCRYCEPNTDNEGATLGWTSKLKCPYYIQKKKTQKAPLAILNTAYALTVFSNSFASGTDNVKGYFGYHPPAPNSEGEEKDSFGFSSRGMSIYDEADELESSIMNFVEVEILPWVCRLFRLTIPTKSSRWAKRLEWLKELVEKITLYEQRVKVDLFSEDISGNKTNEVSKTVIQAQGQTLELNETHDSLDPEFEDKQLVALIELKQKIEFVISSVDPLNTEERRETWVYYREDDDRCKFKPVRINTFAEDALFSRSHINFIMSATIIAPEQFGQDLGLKPEETAFIKTQSPFDPKRRPLFYINCGSMSYNNRDANTPRVIAKCAEIRNKYPGRMLVHTVSYKLNSEMYSSLTRHGFDVFTYTHPRERQAAIDDYLRVENSILLAPSLARGADFKHEKCRLNIIPQIPFPNFTDPQVSRRMYQPTPREGDLWYKLHTIRTIIQAYGRGMRDELDWCRSFVLDEQFMRLWREVKSMLPEWFVSAVCFDSRDWLSEIVPESIVPPDLQTQMKTQMKQQYGSYNGGIYNDLEVDEIEF